MKSLKIVSEYFKKHLPRYFAGISLVFVSTYLNTILPKYIGIGIDALNAADKSAEDVKKIAAFLAAVSVSAFLTKFVWRYLILGFCRHVEFHLREHVFAHLQRLSQDYYVKNNTGDLITRAIVDVQAVRQMLGFATVASIDAVITIIMSVYNMSSSVGFYFTLLAIAPVPPVMFVIVKVRLLVRKRYTKVQEAISDISSKVQENITGIRVMKAFSQEDKESAVFNILSRRKVRKELSLARAFALIQPSVAVTYAVVFSVFLVAGGSMVAKTSISLGAFVSFITYMLLMVTPIGHIGKIVERWQRGVASMRRIDSILLAKPTVDDSQADATIQALETGAVSARNLTFSYETSGVVLDGLSFEVPSGGSAAVMGPTGCGKSTLIGLLIRLWKCQDSMLFADGKDINTIPLETLRNSCAYVPQESFLFSDTILENIRFYDRTISDERVYEAARAANIHEDIEGFPNGYQTVVGERGMTLSGGQKQRIAFARALVTNPKILLLDDCMSAVDSETEKQIIQNLKTRISACTAFIVTHRLSAALLADTVIILDENGRVAQQGTHERLSALGGAYAELVEAFRAAEAAESGNGDSDEKRG